MRRIMLVDDEPNILSALQRSLLANATAHAQLTVETFESPNKALERARFRPFDLVISDYRMPEMDGVCFLKQLKVFQPTAAAMIMSGYADLKGLTAAINEVHIYRFIPKPWVDEEVVIDIFQAMQQRDLLLENQRLADELRIQTGRLSKQEHELRRLEEAYPGITRVNWGPDGSVMLDEEFG